MADGALLARNTLLSFAAEIAPLPAAILCMPVLIGKLGTGRFGVLTLMWALAGYMGLFDVGLGRAVTKLVADKIGARRTSEIPALVSTALLLTGGLGLAGAMAFIPACRWLVTHALSVPPALRNETIWSLYLLAGCLPILVSTAGLNGVLSAFQRFDVISKIRIPLAVFTFAGPLAILPFSTNLIAIILILLLGRLAAWAAYLYACLDVLAEDGRLSSPRRSMLKPLLSFGGWVTVSNLVSPLMVYSDRFIVGSVISLSAAAYYAAPFDVVTRLWIIPTAACAVMFPALSHELSAGRKKALEIFDRANKYVLLAVLPPALLAATFAGEILTVWLGRQFASQSTAAMKWLAAAVLINSAGFVPFAMIQASHRPDLTAKVHLVELPFYLLGVWWMTHIFGIEGTAIAWTARVAVDTCVMSTITYCLIPSLAPAILRTMLMLLLAIVCMYVGATTINPITKVGFVIAVIGGFSSASWLWLFAPEERAFLRGRLRLIVAQG